MQVKIVQNLNQLINIKTEYCKLYNETICSDVFISYEWLVNTIKYFISTNDKIHIITIWESDNIIAMLPLCIRKQKKLIFSYKYLTHLCFKYADYCSFLINKNSNYKAIFKIISKYVTAISQTYDFIRIENISTTNEALIFFFTKLQTKTHKSQLFRTIGNPILNLNNMFNIDKLEHMDALRRRKNIKASNNYKFNINNINNFQVWNKIYDFRKEKYGINSIFYSKSTQQFFFTLNSSSVKLSTLEINNEIVAIHYGFVYKSKFYYYMPAYAQKIKKSGVGRILMLELIEWCKNNNIKEFNFLIGLENYKFAWSNKISENKMFFAIINNKFKNKILYYLYLIIVFYRKFIKQQN